MASASLGILLGTLFKDPDKCASTAVAISAFGQAPPAAPEQKQGSLSDLEATVNELRDEPPPAEHTPPRGLFSGPPVKWPVFGSALIGVLASRR